MLKKSPILFALAVFVLVVGWPITTVQAHCKKGSVHWTGHPHCDNEGGGPTNKARYDVTVSGDLSSGRTFVGRDGGGKNKPVHVGFQIIDLDLVNFFPEVFGGRGQECFGKAPVVGNTISLSIYEEKDGFAYVTHWFTGHEEDGITEITYLFEMFDGVFVGDWRPAQFDMTTVTFPIGVEWEMSINGNNENACTGTGYFTMDQTIDILNTTP